MSNASNLVTWEGLLDEHVANQANANKIIGMEDDDDDEEQISDNEDMGASPAGQSEQFLNVGKTTGGEVSQYYFDILWSKKSRLTLISTRINNSALGVSPISEQ